jgi:hypothetical protein
MLTITEDAKHRGLLDYVMLSTLHLATTTLQLLKISVMVGQDKYVYGGRSLGINSSSENAQKFFRRQFVRLSGSAV